MPESSPIYLEEKTTRRLIPAELRYPATRADFKCVENDWNYQSGRRSVSPLFDWPTKHARLKKAPRNAFFSVSCGGTIQGMMLIRHPEPSRIEPGEQALSIDFLESAPWNLPGNPTNGRQQFRGVGTIMLAAAAFWSRHRFGYYGRVSLLSVPGATLFYDRWMTRGEQRPGDEPLTYFEMTPTQADQLLMDTDAQ